MTEPAVDGSRVPYLPLCVALGLLLGWLPTGFHGPVHDKFDVYYIDGATAVWGWYLARMSIGFWIGATAWPPVWWLRGPLCGLLAMLPLTLVSLAMENCGWP